MQHGAIFAGFGGQGLLFCGHVLAEASTHGTYSLHPDPARPAD